MATRRGTNEKKKGSIMKARKLNTVKAAITKTESELEGLRAELPKSKSRVMDIQVRRELIVYKAKTGDEKAQSKLAELNKQLDAARVEMEDFATAIKQGEAKKQTLEVELTASKQETGLELIRECGEGQVERHKRIVKATAEIVSTQQESRQVMDKLRVDLTALDFKELNIDADLYKLTANFISNTLYGLYSRSGKFERPAVAYHRNTPLLELVKNLFNGKANSSKQLLRDPNEGILEVNLSNERLVTHSEMEEHQALANKMKAQASEMRSSGVPA